MSGSRIRSLLRGVDFVPVRVAACECKHRDNFGRVLYRPLVDGQLGGSIVRIVPMDIEPSSSTTEAIELGEKWAELL
jgi:hypothetical protein